MHTSWFFTAPVEDVAVRRGDPLGLQAVAEQIADALAPGLSNRTVDARWISILCWCLRESQSAWKAFGDGRDDAGQASTGKQRYSWIRPLELLWVARAAELAPDGGRGRQLPGIRPIRRWIDQNKPAGRFSFAESSYEQYRFTGAYGGYRATLRALHGMTAGGAGWQPDSSGLKLAEIVGAHVKAPSVYPRRRGPAPTPEKHWSESLEWKTAGAEFFPTVLALPSRLNGDEALILRDALFATKKNGEQTSQSLRRFRVADAAARSPASTRPELMADLARALKGEPELWLPYLAAFTALADAGTTAMNACWGAVAGATDRALTSGDVVESKGVRIALHELVAACRRWKSEGSDSWSPRAGTLAQTILSNSPDLERVLCRLVEYHATYGGGLKWVILDNGKIRPVARLREGDASVYRYRLPALTRLAKQCGVTSQVSPVLEEQTEAAPAELEVLQG